MEMKEVAYIFPGQSAQYVGMGRSLYDSHPQAREIFDRACEVLKFDLKKLCFEGPKEELTRTSNSQVAILVHSIAALKVLENGKNSDGTRPRYNPKFALGLSLGEYTALVASGCLSFEDGVILVRKRGQFMDEASRKNPGKMASVIDMDMKELERLCKGFGCEIANLNCPGQVVISGPENAIELTVSMAKERGAKRAVILEVSGAFHSSLMKPAREKLEKEINKITFNRPEYPVVSNVTATATRDPEEIKKNLIVQLTSRTYWESSIRYVSAQGIDTFLEIGPGSVLKGLLRRIDKSLSVINFS